MKRVIVINGPNLNLLGERQIDIYGEKTLNDIESILTEEGRKIGFDVTMFQSNHEGNIIDTIHEAQSKYDYIIINAGAYSHYSIAIRDAISSINIPVIEVHISNIFAREEFRNISIISPVCHGIISGFGNDVYLLALIAISKLS